MQCAVRVRFMRAGIAGCAFAVAVTLVPQLLYAVPIQDGALIVSSCVTQPAISNALVESETCARAQRLRAAADVLAALLTNSDSAVQTSLREVSTADGPLDLLIEAVRLDYLSRAGARRGADVAAACYQALSNNAARAQGKSWYAYKMLHHRLIDYYHTVDDRPALYAAHEALINYDPQDSARVLLYVHTMLARKADPTLITIAWTRYARLVPDSPDKVSCAASVMALSGTHSLSNFIRLSTEFTPRSCEELQRWIEVGRGSLRANDPAGARVYADALATAALRLPADDRAIEMVALLLAERQKVEMILATLTNNVARSDP